MRIDIRQEIEQECKQVEKVVENAFASAEHTDHKEQLLVARLRKSEAFVSELSLVAELDEEIAGHIMFTKLQIRNGEKSYESLAMAPVSVLPQYQQKGIGSALIIEGLKLAEELGFKSVIVLGHSEYYPRFGFKPASMWGIKAPFDVPDCNFMALELKSGGLDGVSGMVVYPGEFFE